MVARDDPRRNADDAARPVLSETAAGVFGQWRRFLGGIAHTSSRLARATARTLVAGFRYLRQPAESLTDAASPTLSALGIGGLALGCVLTVALWPLVGSNVRGALFDAAWLLAWALVRLLALLVALPRESAARVRRAWAPALLPYAVAWTGPLSALALISSAWLTFAGLTGTGIVRRNAGRAVALAFGAQAGVEVVRWLARGVLYLVLFSRGF